jgi:hypothetical protein
MKQVAIILWLLYAGLVPAYAQSVETGNDLQEACKSHSKSGLNDEELAQIAYCAGFVRGLLSVGQLLQGKLQFCVPKGVTVGQATKIVLKFLAENPEQTHQSATALTIIAFSNQWACK